MSITTCIHVLGDLIMLHLFPVFQSEIFLLQKLLVPSLPLLEMASSMTPVMSYILPGALLVALSLAKISDTQAPVSSPDEGNAPVDATGSLLDFVPKYFKILDGIQFEKLKSSSSVSAVYFYKKVRVLCTKARIYDVGMSRSDHLWNERAYIMK